MTRVTTCTIQIINMSLDKSAGWEVSINIFKFAVFEYLTSASCSQASIRVRWIGEC